MGKKKSRGIEIRTDRDEEKTNSKKRRKEDIEEGQRKGAEGEQASQSADTFSSAYAFHRLRSAGGRASVLTIHARAKAGLLVAGQYAGSQPDDE